MLSHLHESDQRPTRASTGLDRRDFLKLAGFTLAGSALPGCQRGPVEKAIPYLVQPEEITPGVALWYASTCAGCSAGCGLLVKNRDGRPIKLEGNPLHPLSKGGLCAVGQACLLDLYDAHRYEGPRASDVSATWEDVDREIMAAFEALGERGGRIRVLTGTLTSPTARLRLQSFLDRFDDAVHVEYEPLSCSAIRDAHAITHGQRILPHYRFDRADVVVSIDADFLGTWISPVEYTAGYRARRDPEAERTSPPLHVQIESRMSLTGAKADRRSAIHPGARGVVIARLTEALARRADVPIKVNVRGKSPISDERMDKIAGQLWEARGRSLVVCGANDVQIQSWINIINHLLGSEGTTAELDRPSRQQGGDDRALKALVDEILAGDVDALLIQGVNPVYDLPRGQALGEAIRKVPLSVSFAPRPDETAQVTRFICPEPHFLESWSDAEPVAGVLSVTQPVIQRMGDTRAFIESLTVWTGRPESDRDILQRQWRESFYPRCREHPDFQSFWDHTVHDGVASLKPSHFDPPDFRREVLEREITASIAPLAEGHLTLELYPKVAMRDGRHAHNAWLQELPDPITRITWDNYASLSPAAADRLGLKEGDVVRIIAGDDSADESTIELPTHIQPGQHDGVVAVALGYGRLGTERFAGIGPQWIEARPTVGPDGRVGRRASHLMRVDHDPLMPGGRPVRLEKTGRREVLAATQMHHTLEVPKKMALAGHERRDAVRVTDWSSLDGHGRNRSSGADHTNTDHHGASTHGGHHEHVSLWPDHRYPGRRWGMAIDLNACTGCGACVLACQVENNIPTVGRDEVRRGREMHWMRVDHYIDEHGSGTGGLFQPMLCQHCENAPCETVCPVLATVHSEDGLNHQVYNRCVGTRYCANNCPYKVRRFNWFHYARDDELQNLVLNPDVTVRSQGVMEKCSFCLQRIQAARIDARGRGEDVRDGEIQTACQQSCPAQAIVFGDMNDPESRVSRLTRDGRYYRVLEELNIRPAVGYLSVVRNTRDHVNAEGESEHG